MYKKFKMKNSRNKSEKIENKLCDHKFFKYKNL